VSILLCLTGRKDLRHIGDRRLGCLHRLESSGAVMTSSTPMTFGSAASGLRHSDLAMQKGGEGAYVFGHSFRSEGSSGFSFEGEPRFWNLHGLWAASPIVAPRR
jgi:hypothetical protein